MALSYFKQNLLFVKYSIIYAGTEYDVFDDMT